jgi:hypothetical protein
LFAVGGSARRMLAKVMPLDRFADLPTIVQLRTCDRGDHVVFTELAAVLSRHHAHTRFGITLLYRRLPLRPGEIMLEQTDILRRRAMIMPTTDCRTVVEVAWRLYSDRDPVARCIGFALRPDHPPLDLPPDEGSWA